MKEEYKRIFDELTPDEGFPDIKKPRVRRGWKPAVALLLAFVLTCGIILHGTRTKVTSGQRNREEGAAEETLRPARMVLIAGAKELNVGEEQTNGESFSAPMNYTLRLFSLQGMTEEEKQALIFEQREKFGIVPPERLDVTDEGEVRMSAGDKSVSDRNYPYEGEYKEPDSGLPFVMDMLFADVYAVIQTSDAFTIRVPDATALMTVTANCGEGSFLWVETYADQGDSKGTHRSSANTFAGEAIDLSGDWSSVGVVRAYDEDGNVIAQRTENVRFSDNSRKLTVEGSFYQAANGYVKVVWFPSETLIRELSEKGENGALDLTAITDTITFTAQFNDGSTETCVTNLSFDADGRMHVTVV